MGRSRKFRVGKDEDRFIEVILVLENFWYDLFFFFFRIKIK